MKKDKKPYSEDKMRVLVDNIYNVLNLLYDSLKKRYSTQISKKLSFQFSHFYQCLQLQLSILMNFIILIIGKSYPMVMHGIRPTLNG